MISKVKIGLISCAIFLHVMESYAQNNFFDLKVEARLDYQRDYLDGDKIGDNTGFKGKYVNIQIGGNISENFSYSYRQRMIKANNDQSLWDATDWMWLKYKINDRWDISAGKEVVMIGGYEYDRAPIDLYQCSEFWNNVPCYQMGFHLGYTFNQGKDQINAQFCQSPFRFVANDLYAYNLIWYGSHDWWNTIWSVNMSEYDEGRYISYIALGNQFQFGNIRIQLDLMNRAADHQTFLAKDCSVMCDVAYKPCEKLNIYAKGSYDVNKTNTAADLLVMSGTEITRLGCGFEIFPLGTDEVRLHGCYSYSFGKNSNPSAVLNDKQSYFDLGVTWRIRPLKYFKK